MSESFQITHYPKGAYDSCGNVVGYCLCCFSEVQAKLRAVLAEVEVLKSGAQDPVPADVHNDAVACDLKSLGTHNEELTWQSVTQIVSIAPIRGWGPPECRLNGRAFDEILLV